MTDSLWSRKRTTLREGRCLHRQPRQDLRGKVATKEETSSSLWKKQKLRIEQERSKSRKDVLDIAMDDATLGKTGGQANARDILAGVGDMDLVEPWLELIRHES